METELNGFDEFWRVFPRHVAKQTAVRMYRRALKLATPEVILRGAERYARERRNEDSKFTKHPATWLNGGCWDDEGQSNGNGNRNSLLGALDRLESCLDNSSGQGSFLRLPAR